MDNFKLEGGSKLPRTTPTLEDQHALARSRGNNLFSKSVSHLERFPVMVKCLTVVGQSTHGSSQDSWEQLGYLTTISI